MCRSLKLSSLRITGASRSLQILRPSSITRSSSLLLKCLVNPSIKQYQNGMCSCCKLKFISCFSAQLKEMNCSSPGVLTNFWKTSIVTFIVLGLFIMWSGMFLVVSFKTSAIRTVSEKKLIIKFKAVSLLKVKSLKVLTVGEPDWLRKPTCPLRWRALHFSVPLQCLIENSELVQKITP